MEDIAATGARRSAFIAFMALLGLAGWALILSASYTPGFGPQSAARPDLVSFALFLVVIVAARIMASHLITDTVVSLDSGFYIAAAACLGSVTSGRLVALALTLDSLSRLVGRERRRGAGSWDAALAYVLYFGGMSGALLMLIGWGAGLDSLSETAGVSDVGIAARVIGTGVVFLILHYTIQGARAVLGGSTGARYLRTVAVPSVLAEVALLPLAAIVVFLYHPDEPIKFVLLGSTYLVLNYAFNRIWNTSRALRRRVGELETLATTSRALAASLQLHELVDAVARETMAAIPEADILALTHHGTGDEAEQLIVDYYDRERQNFDRARIQLAGGGTRWVLQHGKPLLISDTTRTDVGVELHADSGVRSWMGVPLVIYGNVDGVLAIQSRSPDAFDEERLRLLEAIGGQAAVALENARLYELAMVDGLTGLFVRRYFDARLEEEIERSNRFSTVFSVVIMDIDNFKQLNDTHGHIAGDRTLRGIADIVRSQMRAVDTAARYGGEEFSMLLPRTSMVDALNQAERIRTMIDEYRLAVQGDSPTVLSTTASFGIAAYPESGARSAEELIRLADRALYRAKHAGKNRVELYWADEEAKPALSVVKDTSDERRKR